MEVSYLREIEALNDWELMHPLPATAYKVFAKLLYLANKERFPERISVPNGVLISMVGCSEDSLIKARNHLMQYGLIGYKGQKKATPVYTIHYFSLRWLQKNNPESAGLDDNTEIPGIKQGIKQGYEQGIKRGIEHGYGQGLEPRIYTNTPKEIYTAEEDQKKNGSSPAVPDGEGRENAAAYIRSRGIALDGRCCMELIDFSEAGITDEMISIAADEAVYYNKLSFAYISRIVNSWITEGICTAEAARARQERFRAEQETAKAARMRQERRETGAKPKFFSERWCGE